MHKKRYHHLCLVLFLLMTLSIQAQDSLLKISPDRDDNNYRKEKVFSGFYITGSYLNWTGLPDNVSLKKPFSCNYSFFTLFNFLKYQKHFNIASGISISANTFQNNVSKWEFDSSSGKIVANGIISSGYKKNKTTLAYLGIPLEIKFKIGFNPKRAINLGVGTRGGILINPRNILVQENVKTITKIKDNFNKFNYGIYGYIGYRYAAIFGQYQISNTFDNSFAPGCRNWSVGLALML